MGGMSDVAVIGGKRTVGRGDKAVAAPMRG
jgi:hypothetical protein